MPVIAITNLRPIDELVNHIVVLKFEININKCLLSCRLLWCKFTINNARLQVLKKNFINICAKSFALVSLSLTEGIGGVFRLGSGDVAESIVAGFLYMIKLMINFT